MRIWDLHPMVLCRKHLAGEHRELHAIWNILVQDKSGYRHHPEVLRWEGKLKALERRHQRLVREFGRRGWTHKSPLTLDHAVGMIKSAWEDQEIHQNEYVNTIRDQIDILNNKPCECKLTCV